MVLLAATGLFMSISTSENRRLAALVREHDSQLAALNAHMAVTEMHAAISHELNNPLTALFNYVRSAAMMLDVPGEPRSAVGDVIDKAQQEAMRAVEVVSKLRTFYRTGEVRSDVIDPQKLAGECVAALQPRIQFAGIACTTEVAQNVPQIKADALQISMVIQNLLANAIDVLAGTASRRKIALRIAQVGSNVEFHVIDNGGGMPESVAAQLFQPLNSTKSSGMGLGLAICRALVEANDGRIWLVASGPGGTDIAFSLPAHAA
jgi:two-component system sensor kinase FixL